MKPGEGQLRQSLGHWLGKCVAWEQGGIVVPTLSPQLLLGHLGVGCAGLGSATLS